MRSRKARASRPLDPAVQSVFHRAFNLEFSRETGTLTLVVVLVPWLPMASWAAASRNSPRPSKTVSASGPRALLMGRSHSGRQPVRRVFPVPVPEMAAVFLPVALSAKTSASASGDSCAERSSRGFCSSSLPIILQSAAMLSWAAPERLGRPPSHRSRSRAHASRR